MNESATIHSCIKCGAKYSLEGTNDKDNLCVFCLLEKKSKQNSQEVTIVPALLDASRLNTSSEAKEYRPSSFNEYVGQEPAKAKVQSFIEGCKTFNEVYPHTFISAPSGMGKTLFCTILANQLKKKIIFTTGGEIKSEQIFIDKLVEAEGGIIFVDEANRLPKRVGFFILPLMEQFEIQGKAINKFSVFFATTHKGDISKDLDALIQRCEQVSLIPYTSEELSKIILQYKAKQYPSIQLPENVVKEIIISCRQTPRNAKNLVRAFAYCQDWNKVKMMNNIIKEGLTELDIKTLTYLNKCGGAGKNAIANHLRVKAQTYEWDVEPYLVYKEMIEINNKRIISEKGKAFINGL